MPCCPILLSLYCIVIVFLNEINGDGDGYLIAIVDLPKPTVRHEETETVLHVDESRRTIFSR